MAKSTRSKVKRAYRAKKREAGVYAAAEAARLHRLNAKLARIVASEEDMPLDNSGGDDNIPAVPDSSQQPVHPDNAPIDAEKASRISTHGFRNSRREEWRRSKGMPARRGKGTNRRGSASTQRKAAHGKSR